MLVAANATMWVPAEDLTAPVVVRGGFDAADGWIAGRVGPGGVVVTADIPPTDRGLKRGARVLRPRGDAFSEDSIGEALATRALLGMLRQGGESTGGPAGFAKDDRSRSLTNHDETPHAIRRQGRG